MLFWPLVLNITGFNNDDDNEANRMAYGYITVFTVSYYKIKNSCFASFLHNSTIYFGYQVWKDQYFNVCLVFRIAIMDNGTLLCSVLCHKECTQFYEMWKFCQGLLTEKVMYRNIYKNMQGLT